MRAAITGIIMLVSIIAHGQSLSVTAGGDGFSIGQVFYHQLGGGLVIEGMQQPRETYVFTSIKPIEVKNTLLYPNPFSSILHFNGEYSIYDLTGRKIMHGFSEGTIDTGTLNAGVYLFKSKGLTKKIIKN